MVKFTSNADREKLYFRNALERKGRGFLMNKNQITKEKTCAFYASDYHFEMITLPYIEKKLEEHKEVVVLTENKSGRYNENINVKN